MNSHERYGIVTGTRHESVGVASVYFKLKSDSALPRLWYNPQKQGGDGFAYDVGVLRVWSVVSIKYLQSQSTIN